MMPPESGNSINPNSGTGWPGLASCHRMSTAIAPPTARKIMPVQMNCLAMTLWSWLNTYFLMNVSGGSWMWWTPMASP